MGKPEEDRRDLTERGPAEASDRNADRRFCGGCGLGWISAVIGLKCFLVLILSVGLFLSALFLLPPFRDLGDHNGRDPYSKYRGHQIVASFEVKKPASLLQENALQLEKDISDEIGVRTTKVVVLEIEPSARPNITDVIFAVDSERKHSKVSPTARSLLRESFEALVLNKSSLHLTESLFGEPFFFQVLKFQGGILVSPTQRAFLLQATQNLVNFTLNYSINQLIQNFGTLTSQLRIGLHLAPYENLYMTLLNFRGSTVFPPSTIQCYVVLAVGNSASVPRLKQLAQTIKGSHSRNLGLNNTVFGRVKQVRLSSILQHFLNGGDHSATSPSPSPAPLPESRHRHHQHHYHHNHQHRVGYLAPKISPSPAPKKHEHSAVLGAPAPAGSSPSPQSSPTAKPPTCPMGNKRKPRTDTRKKPSHLAPAIPPDVQHHHFASSPHQLAHRPAKSPATKHQPVAASSPSPHAQPPSISKPHKQSSKQVAALAPSPSSSSAGSLTVQCTISLLLLPMVFNM